MKTKTFRTDWYPHQAFIDFSRLEAEEIGVLMQIINLIYIHNGPIHNDPKHIGKNCDMGKAKCARVINKLIHKECIYLTFSGKISQKRCEIELDNVQKRREIASQNGKKGAKTLWEDQEKQSLNNGKAISNPTTSTIPESNASISTDTIGKDGSARQGESVGCLVPYNIDHHLDDDARQLARANAPGRDLQELMRIYNEWINSGEQKPPNFPNKAFPVWCKKYTKEKFYA